MTFAEFLYDRRKKLGLTQQNIADRLNVSNKAVSKWETGDCFPETSLLVPLAGILECSVDELLRGRFSSGAPSVGNDSISDFDEEKAEIEMLCAAAEKKQDRPLKLWQALCIAIGVALVFFGIVAMLVISVLGSETERCKNFPFFYEKPFSFA